MGTRHRPAAPQCQPRHVTPYELFEAGSVACHPPAAASTRLRSRGQPNQSRHRQPLDYLGDTRVSYGLRCAWQRHAKGCQLRSRLAPQCSPLICMTPPASSKRIFVYLPAELPHLKGVRDQPLARQWSTTAVIRGASHADLVLWHAKHIQAQSTHVDMAHALAHADVLITHAGHSTVCQALLAGVPMVLIPRSLETRHTAIAAVHAGAAVIADMPEGDDSVINDLAGSIEQAKALTHPRARRQARLDPAKAGEASGSNIKGANGQTTNEAEG